LRFRFFKANDLYELFTLTETDDRTTETAAIFAGTGSDVKVPKLSRVRRRREEEVEEEGRAALPVSAKRREPTRPVVQRSLERLYAAEAAEGDSKSAVAADTGFGTPASSSKCDESAQAASSSLLSEKLREELREKARKINSLIFKAKQHQDSSLPSSPCSPPACSPSVASSTGSDQRPAGGSRDSPEPGGSSSPQLLSGGERREKKKKHRKDKKFEGTRVPHLTKVRPYRPPPSGDRTPPPPPSDEDKEQTNQDDYVLAKLFAKTGGIHSALRHDAIVDDDGTDHALLEAEAAAAAKAAVKALRESRRDYSRPGDRQLSSSPAAATAKRFGKKKSGSGQLMTSADLLARIRARNSVVTAVTRDEEAVTRDEESLFFPTAGQSSSGRGGGEEQGGLGARHSELLADIRNFIAFQVRVLRYRYDTHFFSLLALAESSGKSIFDVQFPTVCNLWEK
jgi:DNA excision repair protein ERCC-6